MRTPDQMSPLELFLIKGSVLFAVWAVVIAAVAGIVWLCT